LTQSEKVVLASCNATRSRK